MRRGRVARETARGNRARRDRGLQHGGSGEPSRYTRGYGQVTAIFGAEAISEELAMACGKYSDSITDLAAGGVNPRRERELLLHAGECDACREAYRHAKEVFSVLDRSVETLVEGQPSPYFSAPLRARIADRRDFSTRRNSWVLAATGALAAIFLGFILVSRLSLPTNSNPFV